MTLSQSLYLPIGIACSTLRPTRYFMKTMLTSPTSIALDCDRKRFSRSVLSVACILIVKPRSLVACSLIPCSSAWAVGERSSARSLGSPAHVVAAVHQRQDAGAELLHADNKIVKGQHHAAHSRHRGHL